MKKSLWILLCLACAASVQAADLAATPAKTLYAAKCATCHAKDAKGNPNMAKMFGVAPDRLDLTKDFAAQKDAELAALISQGKGKMPAYGKQLKPEDIDALVALIRSWGPAAAPAKQDTPPAQP